MDLQRDDSDRGLAALVVQPLGNEAAEAKALPAGKKDGASDEQIKSLKDALASVMDSGAADEEAAAAEPAADAALDEFPQQMDGGDAALAEAEEIQRVSRDIAKQQHLFDNCYVFLSREVPRYSLEFVIAACGGKVGWLVGPAAIYKERKKERKKKEEEKRKEVRGRREGRR